jgi:hypothetical protein
VLVCYPLISISFFANRLVEDVGKWAYMHRWTLSSHLWNAPSSFEFFQAWREKPLWIISAFEFDDFVKNGCGDDLDEFAKALLTMYVSPHDQDSENANASLRWFGVDETKTFCYGSNNSNTELQLA